MRAGQEIKSYISNGNTCKCVTLKANVPENVSLYPNNTFNYILLKKSISLSSARNVIKFKNLNLDKRTINYPNESLRMINKTTREYINIELFKKQAVERLREIHMEEFEISEIRSEQRQLEIIRDILSNILKNQSSHTINLIELENITPIYIYALKQIITRYRLNYTFIGSFSNELNEE